LSPPRLRRGFTVIEVMISAAVGMLLLAGAFEMHAAFNRQSVRQQETADMQQALRVAAQVIGRSLRDAGTGLAGGTAQIYNGGYFTPQPCPVPTGAAPVPNPLDVNSGCLWPVQFGNRMPYSNPIIAYDNTLGDSDPDDDWLRIVTFDGDTAVRATAAYDSTNGTFRVSDTRNFTIGGFFFVGNQYPPVLDGNTVSTLGWRTGCIRHVNGVVPPPNPGGAVATPGTVTAFGDLYNPAPALDLCAQSTTAGNPGQSRITYLYPVDRSVVFRIQPANPGPPVTPPQLQAWYSAPRAPSFIPGGQPNFQTLTENIEHMQIALVLSDGTICGNATNSIDIPGNVAGTCNFQNVRAVRLTLSARSSSRWPGWLSQGAVAGQWEDFPFVAPNDGYLRRALTTELQVRNNPWGAP